MGASLESYEALRNRVDRFAESVMARYGEQIACRARCADCCVSGLTVTLVEAVAIGRGLGIDDNFVHMQAGQSPEDRDGGACAFLDRDHLCVVYSSRPLVCRTHGLPIKTADNEAPVACEKNFVFQTPHRSAMLDQETMDTMLFAVNLDYCTKEGVNPLARVSLAQLAALARSRGMWISSSE